MNCPKCGFSQPDDLYCALCGVHVDKYTRQKKKKRLKISIFTLFLGCGAVVLGILLWGLPKESPKRGLSKRKDRVVAPFSQSASKRPSPNRKPLTASRQPRQKQPRQVSKTSVPEPSPLSEKTREIQNKETKSKLTTDEWFQRGMALDDDSETEVGFYQEALKLDPTFAPAFFRLGSIYYRQARYEQADEVFAKFLQHATDDDRDLYDVYVYYSISDVERILEGLRPPPSVSEDDKEAPDKESGETSGEEPQVETTGEDSEEVLTIVHFSPANGHITVPVVLNEVVTAKMLVDTGAGITVISDELADELGLEWERNNAITLKTMAMDVQAKVMYLDTIQVGELKKSSFPVAVARLPIGQNGQFSAILGMDFLNDYTMHIDNKNHTFTLSTKSP